MPGTLSTITSVFPPEERAKAVGIWAGFAGAGGTLGILVSGALLEQFYWGSIFLVTAALAAAVVHRRDRSSCRARESRSTSASTRAGAVLSALGIGLLVLGIIEGPERGWTDPLTLVGADRRRRASSSRSSGSSCAPTSRCSIRACSAHRGFATGSASLFLQFFAMFGFFFVSLQFLQLVLGYSTLDGRARAAADEHRDPARSRRSPGTLSETYGHRLVGGAGLAVSAVGFGLFATLGTGSGFWPFLLVTIVIGAGAALAMTPATNAIVASLPAPSRAWRRR